MFLKIYRSQSVAKKLSTATPVPRTLKEVNGLGAWTSSSAPWTIENLWNRIKQPATQAITRR